MTKQGDDNRARGQCQTKGMMIEKGDDDREGGR